MLTDFVALEQLKFPIYGCWSQAIRITVNFKLVVQGFWIWVVSSVCAWLCVVYPSHYPWTTNLKNTVLRVGLHIGTTTVTPIHSPVAAQPLEVLGIAATDPAKTQAADPSCHGAGSS